MNKVLYTGMMLCLPLWCFAWVGGFFAGYAPGDSLSGDSLEARRALEVFLASPGDTTVREEARDTTAVLPAENFEGTVAVALPVSDSLAMRRALEVFLASPGDTAAGENIRDTMAMLSMEDVPKDTAGRDSLPAVEEWYELPQYRRDSLRQNDELIRRAIGAVIGPENRPVDVEQRGLPDTLFAAERYTARVYDSLPEPMRPPYVNIGRPERFTLANGLKVIVYPDRTMPVVTFYIGISNQRVFEKEKKGVSELTAAMLLAGVQNRTKAQITDSLANMGSVFRMSRSSFYVSGLSQYAQANFNLFADVVLRPSFPLQEFFTEKEAIRDAYAVSDVRGDVILNRVYRSLAFAGKIPAGEFISDESLNRISLNDCQEYYSTYWRPNNAVLLVMGDVSPQWVRRMVEARFRTWAEAEVPQEKLSVVNDLPSTAVNFIHEPSARDCRIIISNIAEFDYNSPDVFPAMFINHLMGGDLLANIRATLDARPYTGDVFSLSPDPMSGYMYLSTRSPNIDAVRVIAEKTARLQRIRTVPLAQKELDGIKRYLIGRIALSFEDRNALGSYGIAVENGTVKKDFLEDILKQIDGVSSEDVMRVAQKYIKPAQFRIVVYGDARKVVPLLELAGYDVTFYDKYARRMERPSLSQPVTDSTTADDVLRNYFEAMGGERKMQGVKSLRQEYDILIGERKFQAEVLSRLPYYHQEQLFYDGDVYLKQTYNGKMGYTKIERSRTDLSAEEVDKRLTRRSIFPLLDYRKAGFKAELDSIVPVRGHFTYRLKVNLPCGDIQNYYISKGDYMVLRIEHVVSPAVVEKDEQGAVTKYEPEKIGSYSDYDDYKMVEGVKYPFTTEVRDADNNKIIWKTTLVSPNENIPTKVFR